MSRYLVSYASRHGTRETSVYVRAETACDALKSYCGAHKWSYNIAHVDDDTGGILWASGTFTSDGVDRHIHAEDASI